MGVTIWAFPVGSKKYLFADQVYLLFGFYDRFYDLGMLKDGLFFFGFNISKQRLLMIVTPVLGFRVWMLNFLAWFSTHY